MRAIIDLGTNTFHLLIAEIRKSEIQEYFKLQVPVIIGKNGINEGYINKDAFKRGMTALAEFRKYLDQFDVTDVKAFATSAIRNANNGNEFVQQAKEKYNINIETISGEQEAEFIYTGVLHSFNLPLENVLVMDIGGGSVEFIIGQRETILWKQSFELGAARLIDKFHHTEPINDDEVYAIVNHFNEELIPLKEALQRFPTKVLVGSAGSFETLVDIVLKDLAVIPNALSKHAFEIRREDFDVFYELMITSSITQRTKLKGMMDFRVEMIVVAAILMRYIVTECEIKRIISSNYALKEGVLLS
jgi:exopolyphosphatase/guanosine-5'-triphosphate,3'-diphosphate pyrophosphatase